MTVWRYDGKTYNSTTLQLYNFTTLQLYNFTTLQHYNTTTLQPYKYSTYTFLRNALGILRIRF